MTKAPIPKLLQRFRLRRKYFDEKTYEDVTIHGCHPPQETIKEAYVLTHSMMILRYGDIISIDDIDYIFVPSGIEMLTDRRGITNDSTTTREERR